jgi:hypothetical protein
VMELSTFGAASSSVLSDFGFAGCAFAQAE